MTPARWLLDNSALSRLDRTEVEAILTPRIDDALVGVSIAIWVIERRQKAPDQPVEPDRDADRAPKPAG